MTVSTIAAPSDPLSPPASAALAAPKLLGLELLRFACALAVLIFHFKHFASFADGLPWVAADRPLNALLAPVYRFGAYGVEVFWCISGFIFYWKYADIIAARAMAPSRFFWLRFSRLYPLHFVTLLAVAALQPLYSALSGHSFVYAGNDASHFVAHLFLADQWTGHHAFSFNGPIWSVSAEVFVYFAFFALVRAFGKARWLIVAAMAAGLLCIWAKASSPAVICGAFFFAGGAAAEAWRDESRRRQWQAGALFLLITGIFAAPLLHLGGTEESALLTLLLVTIPSLVLLAAQEWRVLDRWQPMIEAAGNLTYSTYLLHFPVQLAFVTIAPAAGLAPPIGATWFLGAYIVTTIALGRIVFLRFEAPAQALIRAATLPRIGRSLAA